MTSTDRTLDRVIRVFVSSTFRDMQAERNELVLKIFPQLRRLCEERGVTWGEIDLRWGISDEQKADGKVLPICLEEIKRCRPYFIGLLGERYGWIPKAISDEVLEREPWIKRHSDGADANNKSVTELEILHGVLNNPEMADHAFFYFRDPAFIDRLPADQKKQDFVSENAQSLQKLNRLKDDIRRKHREGKLKYEPRENYSDAKSLGAQVLADFTALIDTLYPLSEQPSLLSRERLMRRVLAIDEQCYGAVSPYVARDLNNLAQLLKATNRLAEAEPLMRRVLAIDEQSYGAEHPNVARDLNNLAALLLATNRLAEAESLLRRALAIDVQSYGTETPEVPPANPESHTAVDVHSEVCDATKPPIRVDDNVQFTVYRPKSIQPQKWYPLLAYAHLDALPADADKDDPDPTEAVQSDAARTLGAQHDEFANTTQDSSHSVPREGELTFVPKMEGAEFNPTRQTIRWLENYHRVDFRVRSSQEHDGKTLRGQMSVYLGAILLADVSLRIKVDSSVDEIDDKAPTETATAIRYRKIFASYSHRDLAIVEQFEKYMETLGDRYLRDWKELRSGEHWTNRLLQMIEEADVFQLFWSKNSMRSPFVRQEWEHALKLKHKGPSFIRPTYWEEPFPQSLAERLPPSELLQIQFTKLGAAPTTYEPTPPIENDSGSPDAAHTSTAAIAHDEKTTDRQQQARMELRWLEQELVSAFAAFDVARGKQLRHAWWKAAESASRLEVNPLTAAVTPALDWLHEQDQAEREQADYDEAVTALSRALDKDAGQLVLEEKHRAIMSLGRGIPDDLQQRSEELLARHQLVTHRRSRLKIAALLAAVVVVTCINVFIADTAIYRKHVKGQIAVLRQMLNEHQLTEAKTHLSELEARSPRIAADPEIQKLKSELQLILESDRARRAY